MVCCHLVLKRANEDAVDPKAIKVGRHIANVIARAAGSKEDRDAELSALRYRLPHISQVALAALCKYARANGGLPDVGTTREIRAARDDAITQERTIWGPLHRNVQLPLANGKFTQIEIQDPWAMLAHTSSESGWFAGLLKHTASQHQPTPSSPWHLVLYSDEITPGNALAARQERKAQTIYWSFLEFGPHLSNELVWFTMAVMKSKECLKLLASLITLMAFAATLFPRDWGAEL